MAEEQTIFIPSADTEESMKGVMPVMVPSSGTDEQNDERARPKPTLQRGLTKLRVAPKIGKSATAMFLNAVDVKIMSVRRC